jgi:hypothetical protein
MSERVALVTLALGERYERLWRRACEPRWRAYADRHGYDVVCLTEPLDTSPRARGRSAAWQKCLVLEQPFAADYDRVVWVDADVVINPAAPAVLAGVPRERVGAVDEFASPSRELHELLIAKLYAHWDAVGQPYVSNATPAEYYESWGLPAGPDGVVQTGVMVLSPEHHAEVLRRTYDDYDDRGPDLNYEMRPLSWELLNADLVEWIDPAFNCIWGAWCAIHHPFLLTEPDHPAAARLAAEALGRNHMLHFAGGIEAAELLREPAPVRDRAPRPASPGRGAERATSTAVALAVYRRPDLTARVAEAVRRARPPRVLVFADAPVAGDPDAAALCEETLAAIAAIDWECPVEIDVAERHLGARRRMSSGLDWVFGRVGEAIVLEDDCLPDPTFFPYCDSLLERYRDDERVFSVSGNDFRTHVRGGEFSYAFSRYPLIWGWATWARAWRHYAEGSLAWPRLRGTGWLEETLGDPIAAAYWAHLFDQVEGGLDAWDYGWTLTSWIEGGLTAVPADNLVSNLGFRADATHTHPGPDGRSPFAALPTVPIEMPLRHPPAVARDRELDAFIDEAVFSGNMRRMLSRVRAAHHAMQRASA